MPTIRRTSIAPIKTAKNRRLTFSKRRQGLFKKGHEIAVLCQAEVLIVLRDVRGRVFQFAACFPTSPSPEDHFSAIAARTREPKNLVPRPHNGDVNQWIARIATGRAGPVVETRTPFFYDKGCPNLRPISHGDEPEEEENDDDDDDEEFGQDGDEGTVNGPGSAAGGGNSHFLKRRHEDGGALNSGFALGAHNKRPRTAAIQHHDPFAGSNDLLFPPNQRPSIVFVRTSASSAGLQDQMQLMSPPPSVTSPYSAVRTLCDPLTPPTGHTQGGYGLECHSTLDVCPTATGAAHAHSQVNSASLHSNAAAFHDPTTSHCLSTATSLAVPTLRVMSYHSSPVSPTPVQVAEQSGSSLTSFAGSMVSASPIHPIQHQSPASNPTVLSALGTPTHPSVVLNSQLLAASAATTTTPICPPAQHNDPLAFLDLMSSTTCTVLPTSNSGAYAGQDPLSGAQVGRRASVCSTNPSAFSPLSHAVGRPVSNPAAPPLVTISSALDTHPFMNAASGRHNRPC